MTARTPTLYHLVTPSDWEANPGEDYRAASLASEGFIHCSYSDQVSGVANRFYRQEPELLVLQIDPARLTSPWRDDPVENTHFPHVYGPIARDAVVAVTRLSRTEAGDWDFPSPSTQDQTP